MLDKDSASTESVVSRNNMLEANLWCNYITHVAAKDFLIKEDDD